MESARRVTRALKSHPQTVIVCWATTILSFLGLLTVLSSPKILGLNLMAGSVADRDLIAGQPTSIVDSVATRLLEEQAQQAVLPVFRRDHSRDGLMLEKLKGNLDEIANLQHQCGLPLPAKLQLSPRQQVYLLEADDRVWHSLIEESSNPATVLSKSNTGTQSIRPEVETQIADQLSRLHAKPQSKHRLPEQKETALSTITRARDNYLALKRKARPTEHDLLYLAVSVPQMDYPTTRASIEKAVKKLLQVATLFPDAPHSDWEQSALEFLPEQWKENLRLATARIIVSVLEPTVSIDRQGTKVKADAARALVKPERRILHQGDIVVNKGGVITEEAIAALQAERQSSNKALSIILNIGGSLLIAFFLVGIYLKKYEPKHLCPASIGLLSTISIVTCGIAAFVGQQYGQFVPLPAVALVLTIFTNARLATVVTLVLLFLLGVNDVIHLNNLIAQAWASSVAIGTNITQRKSLMFRGFLIGLTQACGYLSAAVITHNLPSLALTTQNVGLNLLGGLSSCIVAIGSLPFLENIFGMVTPFRLVELTDPSQPLLRQLEEQAPGTYQHSLAVANLAESGARAIGADSFLVRAGSLYHDIGKSVRPRYFIENQLGGKNPHDEITPEESRDRVLAHVTDGLSIAQRYAVPNVVQDFIPQHQGTTLMAYFYHKACLRDGIANVDASFYRYPGPKPQSKEAAIVMLADVSEAVTHSLKEPSQDEVEESLGSVFKARWDDGQFTESGLTEPELDKVKKAFARVWRTLHHERLKYPSTTTGRMPVPPPPPAETSSPNC